MCLLDFRATKPAFEEVHLTWKDNKGNLLDSKSVKQAPMQLPPLFNKYDFALILQ